VVAASVRAAVYQQALPVPVTGTKAWIAGIFSASVYRYQASTGSEARTVVTPAAKTRHHGYETRSAFETIRAEALFASNLQSSELPSPDEVRRAVAATLRRLGIRGCAAQLAGDYGDRPDTAAARMTWALTTIRTVYPTPSATPTPGPRSLALAS
jgi:hypothetical protein